MHVREPWLLKRLGTPEGEGMRLVLSETFWLWKHAPHLIPVAWLRTLLKLAGYRRAKPSPVAGTVETEVGDVPQVLEETLLMSSMPPLDKGKIFPLRCTHAYPIPLPQLAHHNVF